jgi:ABC-type lipoprotein release transport system permease subunit
VAIIWVQGMFQGMNRQVEDAMIASEYGGGQYWHSAYDPYDPLTLPDAHGKLPPLLQELISAGRAEPILVVQGSIYPQGRIRTVLLKGIDPEQEILDFPSRFLAEKKEEIPALIGTRMAQSTGLRAGDYVTVQWRDVNGTFDAREARIVQIFQSQVQTIDNGMIWVPLDRLQRMAGMEGEATLVVVDQQLKKASRVEGWEFKNLEFLLEDLRAMIQSKTIGSSIFFVVLLSLAMLAIFDTQVLSIFRRRKEIGTLIALGLTRRKVIQLFTIEGTLHSVLAGLAAAVYGIPLFLYFSKKGITFPIDMDSFGFAIGQTIFPYYGVGLILGTVALVLIVTTIVSFLPTRSIARMKPTEALMGRMR